MVGEVDFNIAHVGLAFHVDEQFDVDSVDVGLEDRGDGGVGFDGDADAIGVGFVRCHFYMGEGGLTSS